MRTASPTLQDLVGQDDEPAEEVLEAPLRREGDREAADPEAGERRRQVHAEDASAATAATRTTIPCRTRRPIVSEEAGGLPGGQEAHRGPRRQETDDADEEPARRPR